MISTARVVALAAAIMTLTGCDILGIGEPIEACTRAGCTSGVTVKLSANPGESYRVEIFEGGATTPAKVQLCSLAEQCSSSVFFADYRPQGNVRVRVVTSRGAITSPSQILNYDVVTPNGPDCTPTCFIALVNMPLPG